MSASDARVTSLSSSAAAAARGRPSRAAAPKPTMNLMGPPCRPLHVPSSPQKSTGFSMENDAGPYRLEPARGSLPGDDDVVQVSDLVRVHEALHAEPEHELGIVGGLGRQGER